MYPSCCPNSCCRAVCQCWQLSALQDHCWSYILRNWHLLQRTPTYKAIPMDQRRRLATDIKQSLSEITTLDSPGDQSQSMGFSVLWDASNTQPDAGNALTPDGKRPVSKATEKRRQRLAEEQEHQRQEEEKRMQQRRQQQTVREIRQRQAAAAEAAGRAAPSSAVQSEAENDSSRRAVPGQRQNGVGQRVANTQQPVQARTGQRAGHNSSPQVSHAKAALPNAGPSRKLALKATTNSAANTASSQKQRPAERRVNLRAGSKSSTPVQITQSSERLNRSNASSQGSGQQGSMGPGSASASAQQQRLAAASKIPSLQHSTAGMPQSVAQSGHPVSGADLQGAGHQQQHQSPVVAAYTAGRSSAARALVASPASHSMPSSLPQARHKSHR